MANQERIVDQSSPVSGRTDDRIGLLQAILEQQQHRAVTYDEAIDVGCSLISFFEILAEET